VTSSTTLVTSPTGQILPQAPRWRHRQPACQRRRQPAYYPLQPGPEPGKAVSWMAQRPPQRRLQPDPGPSPGKAVTAGRRKGRHRA